VVLGHLCNIKGQHLYQKSSSRIDNANTSAGKQGGDGSRDQDRVATIITLLPFPECYRTWSSGPLRTSLALIELVPLVSRKCKILLVLVVVHFRKCGGPSPETSARAPSPATGYAGPAKIRPGMQMVYKVFEHQLSDSGVQQIRRSAGSRTCH
jgi:hypothetical protein